MQKYANLEENGGARGQGERGQRVVRSADSQGRLSGRQSAAFLEQILTRMTPVPFELQLMFWAQGGGVGAKERSLFLLDVLVQLTDLSASLEVHFQRFPFRVFLVLRD